METESANYILTRMAMKHIAVSILQDIKVCSKPMICQIIHFLINLPVHIFYVH